MRNRIPTPNPAVAGLLRSEGIRDLVQGKVNQALVLYRQTVAKRSGDLAKSARAEVVIGGVRSDRWVGRLTVGSDSAPYAASHEFGAQERAGAHDLNAVLNAMGQL